MRSQCKQQKYRQVYAGEIIKEFVEESEKNANDDDDVSYHDSDAGPEECVSTQEASPIPKV